MVGGRKAAGATPTVGLSPTVGFRIGELAGRAGDFSLIGAEGTARSEAALGSVGVGKLPSAVGCRILPSTVADTCSAGVTPTVGIVLVSTGRVPAECDCVSTSARF